MLIIACMLLLSDQRINEIKFWDKEVDDKLDDFKKETDALATYDDRLDKAVEAIRDPLSIAQQCLLYRCVYISLI